MTRGKGRRLALAAAAAAVMPVTGWLAARRQRGIANRLVERLERAPDRESAARVHFEQLAHLPPPVARYLRRALRNGQPFIHAARLRQTGTLRTDVGSRRWLPFEATHVASPPAGGFVWNARVGLAPLVHVRVLDALVAGQGSARVALLSALPVAAAPAGEALTSGAMHRYLAEAVWYPTALLDHRRVRWTHIDDGTALATLTDHGASVSLEFRFNAAGDATAIYTPARWGHFHGTYRQLPWEGHFANYIPQAGMLVPSEGEVGWYFGGEWRPVWKGRITRMDYELRPD